LLKIENVRENVRDLVNEFINDYLEANPKEKRNKKDLIEEDQ